MVRGLDGGVKVLSNINMSLAMLLLLFIIVTGPTLHILGGVVDNVVNYATYLLPLSESHDRADQDWFHTWTIFYWAWWISWSPFVGMFIAMEKSVPSGLSGFCHHSNDCVDQWGLGRVPGEFAC